MYVCMYACMYVRMYVCMYVLSCRIVEKLVRENNPVTLALDGWTNVNHNKVTNLILLCGGRAYYWKSIVNTMEHNTAGKHKQVCV
jgi:hypothetical protein